MKRVLFMQSQTYLGSDTVMHTQIMRHLNRDKFDVHVACGYQDQRQEQKVYNFIRTIPNVVTRQTYFGPSVFGSGRKQTAIAAVRGPKLAISLLELAAYIRKNNIEIIHGTEKPRDAFYGVLLGKLTGAKSVVHLHVGWETWITPMVKWALRNADGVIGVSPWVAETAVTKGGCAPERTYHIVNGIDADRWDPSIDGGPVRREFGVADGELLLAVCSRLFHWKGHIDLLKALAVIKHEAPTFKLLIAGEDDPRATPGRPPFSQELRALVQELQLQDNVIFAGFRSDIAAILAASDIYTMPTYEEPCAVAFLEAMAMKKPVVALASGGTPSMVVDGETGYLAAVGSTPDLAAKLLTLMRDPELRRRMGEQGRARVEQYLTGERMARDAERIYQSILSRTARRTAMNQVAMGD